MSWRELEETKGLFTSYKGEGKMNIFFNKESGQVVVIIYDPNIIGITKLKDILTLSADELRNVTLYFKTRSRDEFEKILAIYKERNPHYNVQELPKL